MNKYQRECKGVVIDVYDVLTAFDVTCPATAHAIKKLLVPGKRGYKDTEQDLNEAILSIQRAIELLPLPQKEEEQEVTQNDEDEHYQTLLDTIVAWYRNMNNGNTATMFLNPYMHGDSGTFNVLDNVLRTQDKTILVITDKGNVFVGHASSFVWNTQCEDYVVYFTPINA